MSLFFQAKTLFNHWLLEVDEHSIHSPFFFDFYTKVLKGSTNNSEFGQLEKLRTDLLSKGDMIDIATADRGFSVLKGKKKALGEIAEECLAAENYCLLYHRIVQHIKAKKTVELGTSLGLTTLYLAAREESLVYTFEASHGIANVALTNFEYFDKKNIQLIEGSLEATLSDFLQDTAKISFVLMNANHRYDATLKYFTLLMKRVNEKSILVVNNIHVSQEMENAWQWLKKNELVYGSIDLYQCGILFFEPSLNKQHFIFSLGKS